MKRKGRRKHCRSNDRCHFTFEAVLVKTASKCRKTDSKSQNIPAALKLEPRGDLLSGPLNTGLARRMFVLQPPSQESRQKRWPGSPQLVSCTPSL